MYVYITGPAATRRPRVPGKSPHLATPAAANLLGAEARHLTTATTRVSEAEERQLTTDPTRTSEAEERQATSAVESAPDTHGLGKRRLEESGSIRATVPSQSRSDVISTCMMSAEDKAICTRIYSLETVLQSQEEGVERTARQAAEA